MWDLYMFDTLPVAYIATDIQGRIVKTNQHTARIIGLPQEILYQKPIKDYIDDKDITIFEKFINKVTTANNPIAGEFRLKTSDNSETWLGIDAIVNQQHAEDGLTLIFIIKNINQCTFKLASDILEQRYVHLDHLLKTSPAIIFSCLPTTNYPATYISKNIKQQTGFEAEQFVNAPNFWVNHIHPDDKERLFKDLDKLHQLNYLKHQYRFQHKNGKYLWIEEELRLIRDDKGEEQEIVGSWNDITERLQAQKESLIISEVMKQSNEGIMITDLSNRFISVNAAFCNMTGYSQKEVLGKTPKLLQSGRHDKVFYQNLWHELETKGVWEGEIWNRNKNGEIYSEWLKINVIKDSNGYISNYVGHSSDIISQKKIRDRLQHLAHYDSLTGLSNRYFFMELLENALLTSQREEKLLCLLFIDLDGFKLLNDTHGHLFGDEVLKQVANILSSSVRKSDIVARLSGNGIRFKINSKREKLLHS